MVSYCNNVVFDFRFWYLEEYVITFYTHKADSIYASIFPGFSVYVSNLTNKNGVLCYHDTNNTVSTITSRIAIVYISKG